MMRFKGVDMTKVYIIEHKSGSGLGKIITFFTGKKYSHTTMFIDGIHCDLALRKNGKDYLMTKYDNIFLLKNEYGNKIDIFQIPHIFDIVEIQKMLNWWKNRELKSYGILKLSSMIFSKWIVSFSRWYYRQIGKPYKIKMIDVKSQDVCSIAVDECLKKGGYDIFPELSERIVYPGLFAEKLKKYKFTKK